MCALADDICNFSSSLKPPEQLSLCAKWLLKYLFGSVYLKAIEKVRYLLNSGEIQFNKVDFKLYYTSALFSPWLFEMERMTASVGRQICGDKRQYLDPHHHNCENNSWVAYKAILKNTNI